MIFVSVIIPTYNASKYLRACLESVIAQTLKDIEIICINDGSIDDSLEILKEFQKEDSRIIIIDQKNQGVSAARNAGLEIAKGKYIGFVDSDDTIAPDFFQILYGTGKQYHCDVVFTRSLSSESILQNNRKYSRQEIRLEILPLYFKKDGHNAIWNKLYAAALIKNNNIFFPVGRTHGEDAEFNIHYLLHAESLFTVDYAGYHYRETEGSATRNVTKFDYLQQALDTLAKDWSSVVGDYIIPAEMYKLKKERFINNIISQIYIYATPENGLSLQTRIGKLHQIINHDVVKQVFHENNHELSSSFTKYKKEVYGSIKSRFVIKLYLLSLYSYYRNK